MRNVITILLIGLTTVSFAQQAEKQDHSSATNHNHHYCGTSEALADLIKKGIITEGKMDSLSALIEQEAQLSQYSRLNNANTKIVIPTVVHIIHDCGNSYISDAQVNDAIRIMNEDFQKKNADTNLIVSAFQGIASNPNFEFRLARKDPNGNCSNGITRTISDLTNSAGDNVKTLVNWNTTQYYNIWVVESIAGGAAAYAYFSNSWVTGSINHGVVCESAYFGSIGRSFGGNFSSRTMTHETGHFFNLPHPWGGSNTPGLASNCSIDDGIGDTPNTIGVAFTNCNTSQTTCNSLDNIQNYMDYSSCARMFTNGQATVMRNTALSSVGGRNNLSTQANLIATGVCDTCSSTPCAPSAEIGPCTEQQVCAGQSVQFTAYSENTLNSSNNVFSWEFTGGTPSTSADSLPSITYSTPGTYPVKLKITNQYGEDSITLNNFITVLDNTPGQVRDVYQSFEDNNWPVISANTYENWEVSYDLPNQNQVEVINNNVLQGNNTIRLVHVNNAGTNSNTFIQSPTIDYSSGSGSVTLEFYYAHADQDGASNTYMALQTSLDCGNSWNTVWDAQSNTANDLSTVADKPIIRGVNSIYVPTQASEYRNVVVNANSGASDFKTRFVINSGNDKGNATYIDAFIARGRFAVPLSIKDEWAKELGASVYPNPTERFATISFTTTESEFIEITMADASGRKIGKKVENYFSPGKHELSTQSFANQLSKGVYFLSINGEKGTIHLPLVVN